MKNHRCYLAFVVMMYLIMAATLLSAQSDPSSLLGTISDSSGIVVPNARGTVRNEAADHQSFSPQGTWQFRHHHLAPRS